MIATSALLMRLRPIQLLLLACLISWASGAAQAMHDRLADRQYLAYLRAMVAKVGIDLPSAPEQRPSQHDRQNCLTCQLLAHASAEQTGAPPLYCNALVPLYSLGVDDWRSALVAPPPHASIRGPPLAA